MRKVAAITFVLTVVPLAIAVAQTRIQGGGSRGVALQPLATTTTNPLQSGSINITGNVVIGSSNPTSALITQITQGFPPGSNRLFLGTGGSTGAMDGGLVWNLYPSDFSSGGTGQSPIFNVFGRKSNQSIFALSGNGGGSGLSVTGIASSGCGTGQGCMTLGLSGCGSGVFGFATPCITTSAGNGITTPLFLAGRLGANDATNRVVVTTGGTTVTATPLFDVLNNGTLEFSVGPTGTITAAGTLTVGTPVPMTSGGTGTATALNCPYIGGNGTAYSCTASPAAILGSGRIASNGTIITQAGLTITTVKGTTGNYTINVTGMTANGVVMVTPLIGSAGAGRMAAATAAVGNFAVYIKSGADGALDDAFQYAIISL